MTGPTDSALDCICEDKTTRGSIMNQALIEEVATIEEVEVARREVSAWEAVEQAIQKHHHKPDLQAARIVYSAVAAHALPGAPVWPMLVAPPGSMKTEMLNGLDGLPKIHFIDHLTPQTFISGQLKEDRLGVQEPSSLLHRIGKSGMIVYPDFSTVLAMNADKQGPILADMRRIYDGKLSKEFGTAENLAQRTWEGRLTFLVAVTPAIDGYYSVFQTLGERFVMVRWPRAGGIEAGLAAMNQDNVQAKAEIKEAVHRLLTTRPKIDPRLSDEMQVSISALAEIAVRGRTHIQRSGYTKEVIYLPEAESNTRLAQQLAQLAKGSALLDGRDVVSENDLVLVRRAAFDCMPPMRKRILETLVAGGDLKILKIPRSSLWYLTEDLAALGLLEPDSNCLSALTTEMLIKAGVVEVDRVAA